MTKQQQQKFSKRLFCGFDFCLHFGYFVQVNVWSWCYGLHASTYWDLHCETTYEVEKAKSVQILNTITLYQ